MPAWISVVSVSVQALSRQPPPMPIQLDECSATPRFRCLTFGTIHSAATEWKSWPFEILPCTYPAQLKDWFAPTTTIGRAILAGAAGDEAEEVKRRARTTSHAAARTARAAAGRVPPTVTRGTRTGDAWMKASDVYGRTTS